MQIMMNAAVCLALSSNFVGAQVVNSDARLLTKQGRGLTAQGVKTIEAGLKESPDDLENRIRLLGYYFGKQFSSPEARNARIAHVLWIIRHHPDSSIAGLSASQINKIFDAIGYSKASMLWLEQVESNSTNSKIIGNAANFFLLADREQAENLLKKAQELEPDNPQWPERLGHLYGFGPITRSGGSNAEAAKKSLRAYERALALTTPNRRYYLLEEISKMALLCDELKKAEIYAVELLDASAEAAQNWNYGNAVHHGNLTLGHVALLRGDLGKAESFLLKAGKTPGSPQLNSFGPNMLLARELLKKGRKDAVIEYLELCGKFWNKSKIDQWIAEINEGKIPRFGANLKY